MPAFTPAEFQRMTLRERAEACAPYVTLTVRRMGRDLPRDEWDDLAGELRLRLCRVVGRWDPAVGTSPETFVISHLRGCAREYWRERAKPVTRHGYTMLRQLARGEVTWEQLEPLQRQRLQAQLQLRNPVSLEEIVPEDEDENAPLRKGESVAAVVPPVDEQLLQQEEREEIQRALAWLPRREAQVVGWYYWDGLTLKEIGARLGVSESRIHQLHQQALRRLRQWVGE